MDKSANENVVDKPRLRAVRRQSYIPKNLLSKKFEEHNNNQIINKANMSVNMDLYRDLFPNLNMNKTDNDLTNINNRSMVITKKKVNIKKILLNSLKNEEFENKYRVLMRNKELLLFLLGFKYKLLTLFFPPLVLKLFKLLLLFLGLSFP